MFSIHSLKPKFFEPNPESQVWGKELLFEKGNSYRVIAPSGSGKSSFILFLSGLSDQYSGDIQISSKGLKRCSHREKSRLRATSISTVFQDLRLINSLSLRENLLLKAGLGKAQIEDIEDLLRFFELEGMQDKKVKLLSQGEKQRAAIIRALLQDFDFLLLDEPFSHLNEGWHSKTWDLINSQCKSRGAGIMLTSLDGSENWAFDHDLIL